MFIFWHQAQAAEGKCSLIAETPGETFILGLSYSHAFGFKVFNTDKERLWDIFWNRCDEKHGHKGKVDGSVYPSQ